MSLPVRSPRPGSRTTRASGGTGPTATRAGRCGRGGRRRSTGSSAPELVQDILFDLGQEVRRRGSQGHDLTPLDFDLLRFDVSAVPVKNEAEVGRARDGQDGSQQGQPLLRTEIGTALEG